MRHLSRFQNLFSIILTDISWETEHRSNARSRPRPRCWWCRWGRSATPPGWSRERTPPKLLRRFMCTILSGAKIMVHYMVQNKSIILCDWLTLLWISRSHLRKSSMVHSADAVGRRAKKMQKMEKIIFQNIFYRRLDFPVWELYQWSGRKDKISLWETNMLGPQLKLCSLCFIQNKNSKHYHQ